MRFPVAAVLAATTIGCIDTSTLHSRQTIRDAGGSEMDAGAADAGSGGSDVGSAVCASCAPSAGCASPTSDSPNLVAGLESGCDLPENRSGRSTFWFTFANGLSTISPVPMTTFVPACVGANGSCYAACVNGLLAGN